MSTPRGGLGLGSLLVALLIILALVGSLGVSAADPPLDPSGAPSPAAATVDGPDAGPWALNVLLRDDIFTAPPDPLTLSPALAPDRAASKVIGPQGGTVKARGADGTRYTLTLPAEAVAMDITVTMIPIESLAGFPDGPAPQHALGVQLEPDGLPLGETATLEVRLVDAPDTALAALDYRGVGMETGFHDFELDGRRIAIGIDHFSGYVVSFPLEAERIRTIARFTRTDPAEVLASEIASILAIERQRQLMDVESDTLDSLAQHYLPLFVEVVLLPRLAAAARGCAQAEAAMAAILSYQRQRQRLGKGDDPGFELPTGGGGGASALLEVPSRLVDLKVRLCFREAHARCVRTGDFPSMVADMWATFKQGSTMFGVEPTPEQIALAHGYLRRCGHYRTTVKLDLPEADAGDFERKERFNLEIEMEWRPGSGQWGILGSTIEGEGEHTDVDFAFREAGCRQGDRISNVRTATPGRAKIESLAFDLVEGPTLTGEPLSPQPRKLVLSVGLGTIRYDKSTCWGGRETHIQDWETYLPVYGLLDLGATRELGSGALRLEEPWTFGVGPFKAEWEFRKVFPQRQGGLGLDLEVALLHEPI